MYKYISVLLLIILSSLTLGEFPPAPDLVTVCESSDIIVVAEPIKKITYGSSLNIEYEMVTFRLHEIIKGQPNVDPINVDTINGRSVVGPFFTVLVQKRGALVDTRYPNYALANKYVLFLSDQILQALYVRSRIDMRREETIWTSSVERQIRDIINVIMECDCVTGDCESNNLFDLYERKEIPITKEDEENKIISKYFFYLKSIKVGERGYYLNGNLAYENKIKSDQLEGLCKKYYYNGNIKQLACYHEGQKHGIMKEYNESGELEKTSFWLANKQVTENEYRDSFEVNREE